MFEKKELEMFHYLLRNTTWPTDEAELCMIAKGAKIKIENDLKNKPKSEEGEK